MFSKMKVLLVVLFASVLTACGGGGGSDPVAENTVVETPVVTVSENVVMKKSQALASSNVVERDQYGGYIVDGRHFPGPRQNVPTNLRVSLFGDSLMLGVGTTVNPLHRIKQIRPGWTVMPHVAGGVSTTNAMTGYDEKTEYLHAEYMPFGAQKPFMQIMDEEKDVVDVVVIQLGFNDAFRSDPKFKTNFVAMIEKVYASGKLPIVTGLVKSVHNVPLWYEYNRFVREYTCGKNIPTLTWDVDTYNNPQWINEDQIHLTQYVSDTLTSSLIHTIENTYLAQNSLRSSGLTMYQEGQCNPTMYSWMDQPPRTSPQAYDPNRS